MLAQEEVLGNYKEGTSHLGMYLYKCKHGPNTIIKHIPKEFNSAFIAPCVYSSVYHTHDRKVPFYFQSLVHKNDLLLNVFVLAGSTLFPKEAVGGLFNTQEFVWGL